MAFLRPRRLYTICLALAVVEAVFSSAAIVAAVVLVDSPELGFVWTVSLTTTVVHLIRICAAVALAVRSRSRRGMDFYSRPYLFFYLHGSALSLMASGGYAWTELLLVASGFGHDSAFGLVEEQEALSLLFPLTLSTLLCAAVNCVCSLLWVVLCYPPWSATAQRGASYFRAVVCRLTPRPKVVTFKFGSSRLQEGDLAETRCVICMEDFQVGCMVGRLPCNHTYHSACIRRWLKQGSRCPMRCDTEGGAASTAVGACCGGAPPTCPATLRPELGMWRGGIREATLLATSASPACA